MTPRILYADTMAGLVQAVRSAGIARNRPVLVLIGGASRMDPRLKPILCDLFVKSLIPMVERLGGAIVDGGTDAGIMRVIGRAHARTGASFPLVGIAAEGTVTVTGTGDRDRRAGALPEPHHSHLILVPGRLWGDESPWLSATATIIAEGSPSATLLINGGLITRDDARRSLSAGRVLIVLAGSGRLADSIAHAHNRIRYPDATGLARSPLTRIVSLYQPQEIVSAIENSLTAR
ncbi:hypothetical protein [Nocardia sp. NPDC046763]|uniref:hypothetical protein n=1 Tax=Nocardia sp. NPDC046763 TaxID=3155256 RepID=UPI00340536FE